MKLNTRLLCLPFWPQRVLGITKVTVWNFMRSKYPDLDEEQFYYKLITLQLDQHPKIIYSEHEMQLKCETKFTEVMQKFGCNFKIIRNADEEAKDDVEWADLIIAIGGNGTFSLASRLIKSNKKAVISINPKCTTDVHCSEIEKVFQKLHKGRYNLLMRRRIRTVMYGESIHSLTYRVDEKMRSSKHVLNEENNKKLNDVTQSTERKVADALQPRRRVLPWLALNEVYMGELKSTNTMSLTIQTDDQEDEYNIKCSGVCVCTGTGSCSWFRSMNFQEPEIVKKLIKMAIGKNIGEKEALCIVQSYNQSLTFDPEDDRMSYTVREMYCAKRWPKPIWSPERGMCRRVKIISYGFDAGLVIDGDITLPFNDGAIAVFEIHPEDALRNLVLQ